MEIILTVILMVVLVSLSIFSAYQAHRFHTKLADAEAAMEIYRTNLQGFLDELNAIRVKHEELKGEYIELKERYWKIGKTAGDRGDALIAILRWLDGAGTSMRKKATSWDGKEYALGCFDREIRYMVKKGMGTL